MTKRKTRKQIRAAKMAEAERKYDAAPLPGHCRTTLNCSTCHPKKSFFEPTEHDQFKFKFGSIKFYSDLSKEDTSKKDSHEVYSLGEIEPKIGDFVKFKNFEGDNEKFNGKLGLIQKEMGHSGEGDHSLIPRFKIATMNEENNFRHITNSNFEIIKNCNSEFNRMEVGEMMWPKVKGMHRGVILCTF